MDNSKLGNYFLYLNVIQNKIDKFFENQKEYILCHEGCAKCCQKAQFPFTEIEFRFLMQGFLSLDMSVQNVIIERVKSIIKEKEKFYSKKSGEDFKYDCPFLVNNTCIVYKFRGILCRCFGLILFKLNSDTKSQIPFCAFEGLNYSNVLDAENKKISMEKFKEQNYKIEPHAFNASYLSLIDKEFAKGFDFEFGEVKPLIDWFIEFGEVKQWE